MQTAVYEQFFFLIITIINIHHSNHT